jgi:hypothetical protein
MNAKKNFRMNSSSKKGVNIDLKIRLRICIETENYKVEVRNHTTASRRLAQDEMQLLACCSASLPQ